MANGNISIWFENAFISIVPKKFDRIERYVDLGDVKLVEFTIYLNNQLLRKVLIFVMTIDGFITVKTFCNLDFIQRHIRSFSYLNDGIIMLKDEFRMKKREKKLLNH